MNEANLIMSAMRDWVYLGAGLIALRTIAPVKWASAPIYLGGLRATEGGLMHCVWVLRTEQGTPTPYHRYWR